MGSSGLSGVSAELGGEVSSLGRPTAEAQIWRALNEEGLMFEERDKVGLMEGMSRVVGSE